MLVFDTTAFVLSVIPCLREKMILRGTGITQILIRDGIIYFALCFAANLANVVSATESNHILLANHESEIRCVLQIYYAMSDDQHNRAYLASLATGIQAMASSRLVFNLRQSSSATTTLSTTGRSISGFRAGTGQWDIPLSGTAGGPHHPTSSSSDAFKSPLHYGPDTEKDDFHEVSDTYAV